MSQIAYRKSYYTTSGLAAILGKIGDFTIDITKKTMVIFDGTTVGGIPLALANHTHPNATGSTAGFMGAVDYVYLYDHTHPNATESVSGFMSASDKTKLDSINGGGGTPIPYTPSNSPNTLVSRDSSGNSAFNQVTATTFVGALTGNASTVTNGVVTTGSYANPSWITSLAGSKITAIPDSSIAAVNWSKLTGTPPVVSTFTNDAGYINGAGNTTGTSGGVLSPGGRETSSPTPRTVIIRDSVGRAQVVDPVANADIATKHYVDLNLGGGTMVPNFSDGNVSITISTPFSTNILNVTQKGFVKSIRLDFPGFPNLYPGGTTSPGGITTGSGANEISVGITSDSGSEYVTDLDTFCEQSSYSAYSTIRGQIVSVVVDLSMSYKTSMVIRFFSAGGTTSNASINYYILNYAAS